MKNHSKKDKMKPKKDKNENPKKENENKIKFYRIPRFVIPASFILP